MAHAPFRDRRCDAAYPGVDPHLPRAAGANDSPPTENKTPVDSDRSVPRKVTRSTGTRPAGTGETQGHRLAFNRLTTGTRPVESPTCALPCFPVTRVRPFSGIPQGLA